MRNILSGKKSVTEVQMALDCTYTRSSEWSKPSRQRQKAGCWARGSLEGWGRLQSISCVQFQFGKTKTFWSWRGGNGLEHAGDAT